MFPTTRPCRRLPASACSSFQKLSVRHLGAGARSCPRTSRNVIGLLCDLPKALSEATPPDLLAWAASRTLLRPCRSPYASWAAPSASGAPSASVLPGSGAFVALAVQYFYTSTPCYDLTRQSP